jgi:glycosyltransferase involved in cell wall biosynthesis
LSHEAEVQFFQEESEQLKQCSLADVIFTQCLYSPSAYQFYRQQVRQGKKLVIDFDDDYFNIPDDSPEKMAVIDRKTGEAKLVTKESRNYWIKAFLRLATVVTVPTEPLKILYEPFCERIEVVPNCLSLDMARDIPKKSHDKIRVLWSGSSSHLPDLKMLTEVLSALTKEGLEVHFQGPIDFKKIFPDLNFIGHKLVDFSEYLNTIQAIDADIALMPLKANDFNRGKSNLKYLQMTFMEAACVASNFGPYAQDILHNKTGLLASNTSEWIENILRLAKNENFRKNLVDNAMKFVKDNFLVNQHLDKWRHALLG